VKPGELKRQVQLAMLTAVALVLHIIESLLPPLPVPGAKIGLANVATLISLRHMGFWSGVTVSAVRKHIGEYDLWQVLGPGVLDELCWRHHKRGGHGD